LPPSITRLSRKSEIRISKSETNSKSEEETINTEAAVLAFFSSWDFEFVSDFEFRIYLRTLRGFSLEKD